MGMRLQADPNRRDAMGETPLHYAALAGETDAARLLIRCGARVDIRSIDEEPASAVAKLNPARFLKIATSKVRAYIRSEEKLAGDLAAHRFEDSDLFREDSKESEDVGFIPFRTTAQLDKF